MIKLLLRVVSDTPPPGGGGVKGWVGGSRALCSGFWEAWTPIPPLGVGMGAVFSWVLGLQALGLRGIENSIALRKSTSQRIYPEQPALKIGCGLLHEHGLKHASHTLDGHSR